MNAAAMLGRLKFGLKLNPRSWLPRGGLRLPFRRTRHRDDWAEDGFGGFDDAPKPRKPKPVALLAAFGALALALAGVGGWLALNGEETTLAWEAGIPQVKVAVKGATPPPPPQPADPAAPAPTPQTVAQAPAAPTAPAAPPPALSAPINSAPPIPAPPIPAPQADAFVTLTPAPAPGLVEETRAGPLPRVAEDGRKPWQVYARPFPATDKRPRIAILMTDLGVSGVTTGNALQKLPPQVTLAFVPYGERLDSWVERARGKGHEVMLSVPMEPLNFPRDDPGSNALLTSLSPERNIERLEWSMSRVSGYTGITTTTGSKFTGNADALKPVMDTLKQRGLLFVDARVNPKSQAAAIAGQTGVPRAFVDRVIDRDLSRGAIDDQLKELEAVAKAQGAAIGLGFPYPSTVERINLWLTGLQDRGFVLAPVSAVVNLQKGLGG
ncbi:MAG TPA: divergent polysaccharide deacetylase family protein [Azospirillum sp.]|nr:divergent polysaccharide deacetylase family protein [Azospirillum sp.]